MAAPITTVNAATVASQVIHAVGAAIYKNMLIQNDTTQPLLIGWASGVTDGNAAARIPAGGFLQFEDPPPQPLHGVNTAAGTGNIRVTVWDCE